MKTSTALVAAVLLFAARAASALELYGVEAYAVPGRVYAGQPFEIRVDIVASQRADLSAQPPGGLPPAIRLGQPRAVAFAAREGEGGRREFVHTVSFPAQAQEPVSCHPDSSRTVVQATIRTPSLFGTETQQYSAAAAVSWRPFEVQPLPREGRPDGFSGAVGRFQLAADVQPATLSPGDIARLTLTLRGDGSLAGAKLAPPPLPPALFKVYAPEALPPAAGECAKVVASVIPLSTQAVEIASASFAYFDPVEGVYKTARSAPLRLLLRERAASAEPAVRTLEIGGAASAPVRGFAQLRLAPSASSLPTFRMAEGEPCETLETTPDGRWLRVRLSSSGHTGWLPAAGDGR